MKLGINEINEGVYLAAINKVSRELRNDGFQVFPDYAIDNNKRFHLDLFAQKGSDKRIYEFRIGKNKIPKNQFAVLQEYAREIRARLFIIYLETPTAKKISFANIEDIIGRDISKNPPSELLDIAPKLNIFKIDAIDINDIVIENDIITLRGQGILLLQAQYGTSRELEYNQGIIEDLDLDFWFRLKYDIYSQKVTYAYYKIDTHWLND